MFLKNKKAIHTTFYIIIPVFLFLGILASWSIVPSIVLAEEDLSNTVIDPIRTVSDQIKDIPEIYDDDPITTIESSIAVVVNFILMFVATIFFILVLYAGFMWMTAQGNEDKVSKAQKLLIQSTLGLAVVFFAYLISFAISALLSQGTGFLQTKTSAETSAATTK